MLLLAGLLVSLALGQMARASEPLWQLTLQGSGEEQQDVKSKDSALLLQFSAAPPSPWQWGYQHHYRVLRLANDQDAGADSNGHLHQTGPWLRYQQPHWQLRLAPQLAVSSNLLRHPNHLQGGDAQLHGHWLHQRGALHWGLAADSRLGRYLPYPLLRWQHQQGGLTWELGLPDNTLRWQPNRHWQWQLSLAPDGGQWQVRDGQLERRSRLRQQRWRLGPSLDWQPLPAITLTLGADYLFAQRLQYQLDNGEQIHHRPGTSHRLWLALQVTGH